MPRFYFHSENGHRFPDDVGTDLADMDAAKVEAVRVMADILKNSAGDFWSTGAWRLTVTDESGLTLLMLDVAATLAPALEG